MANENRLVIEVDLRTVTAEQGSKRLQAGIRGIGQASQHAAKSVDALSGAAKRARQAYFEAGAILFVFNQAIAAIAPLFDRFNQALNAVVSTGAAFESRIGDIATLLGAAGNQVSVFTDKMLKLLVTMPVSADDLGGAAYQVVSAGITDTSDALIVLEESAKLATAGLSTMEAAVDAVTSVLNAYAFTAQQAAVVSGILFNTVKFGKTTMDQISASIGQVLPVAQALGVSFTELQAQSAALTTGGIRIAEAYTNLRQTVLSLLKPSADMEKALLKMGFATAQGAVATLGLQGTLQGLRDQTEGNIATFAKFFGRVQATTAATLLTGAAAAQVARNLRAMAFEADNVDVAFEDQLKVLQKIKQINENRRVSLLVDVYQNWKGVLDAANKAAGKQLEILTLFRQEMPALTQAFDLAAGAALTLGSAVGRLFELLANVALIAVAVLAFKKMNFSFAAMVVEGGKAGLMFGGMVRIIKTWSLRLLKAGTLVGALAFALTILEGVLRAFGTSLRDFLPDWRTFWKAGQDAAKEDVAGKLASQIELLNIQARELADAGKPIESAIAAIKGGVLKGEPIDLGFALSGLTPAQIQTVIDGVKGMDLQSGLLASSLDAVRMATEEFGLEIDDESGRIENMSDVVSVITGRLRLLEATQRANQLTGTVDPAVIAEAERLRMIKEGLNSLDAEGLELQADQAIALATSLRQAQLTKEQREIILANEVLSATKLESLANAAIKPLANRIKLQQQEADTIEGIIANLEDEIALRTATKADSVGTLRLQGLITELTANQVREQRDVLDLRSQELEVFSKTVREQLLSESARKLAKEDQLAILAAVSETGDKQLIANNLSKLGANTLGLKREQWDAIVALILKAEEEQLGLNNEYEAGERRIREAVQAAKELREELANTVNIATALETAFQESFDELLTGKANPLDLVKGMGDAIVGEFTRGFTAALVEKAGFDKEIELNLGPNGSIMDLIGGTANGIVTAFGDAFDAVIDMIPALADALANLSEIPIAGALFDRANLRRAAEGAGIGAFVGGAFAKSKEEKTGAIIGGAIGNVLIRPLGKGLADRLKPLFGALGDTFAGAADEIGFSIGTVFEKVLGVSGLGGLLSDEVTKGFQKLGSVIQGLFAGIGKVLGAIAGIVGSIAGSVLGMVLGNENTRISLLELGQKVADSISAFKPFANLVAKLQPSRRDVARKTFDNLFTDVLGVRIPRQIDQGATELAGAFVALGKEARATTVALAVLAAGSVKTPAKAFEEFDIALNQLSFAFAANAGLLTEKGSALAQALGGDLPTAIDNFIKVLPRITDQIINRKGIGFFAQNPEGFINGPGKQDPSTRLSPDRASAREQLILAGLLPTVIGGIVEIIKLIQANLPTSLGDVPEDASRKAFAVSLRNLGNQFDIFDFGDLPEDELVAMGKKFREEIARGLVEGALDGSEAFSQKAKQVVVDIFGALGDADEAAAGGSGVLFKQIRITIDGVQRQLTDSIGDLLLFARELNRGIFTTRRQDEKVGGFQETGSQLNARDLAAIFKTVTVVEARRIQELFQTVAQDFAREIRGVAGDETLPDDFDIRLNELVDIFLDPLHKLFEEFDTVEEILDKLNEEFQLNLTLADLDITGEDIVRRLQLEAEAFSAVSAAVVEASGLILAGEDTDEALKAFGLKLRDTMIQRTQEALGEAFFRGTDFDNLLSVPFNNLEVGLEQLFKDLNEGSDDFDFGLGMDDLIANLGMDFEASLAQIEAMGPVIEAFADMQERIVLAMTTFTQAADIAKTFVESIDLMIASFSGNAELLVAQRESAKLQEAAARQQRKVNEILARGAGNAGPGSNLLEAIGGLEDEDLKRLINELGEMAAAVTDSFNKQIQAAEIQLEAAQAMADVLIDAKAALVDVRGRGGDPLDVATSEFENERDRVEQLIRQFRTGTDEERAAAAQELVNLGPALLDLAEAAGFDPGSKTFEDVRSTLETVLQDVIESATAAQDRVAELQEEIRDLQAEAVAKLEEIRLVEVAAAAEARRRAERAETDREKIVGPVGDLTNIKEIAEKTLQKLNLGINVFRTGASGGQTSGFDPIEFARGGIVTSNGGAVPALLHGPEAVIPLKQLPQILGKLIDFDGLANVFRPGIPGVGRKNDIAEIIEVLSQSSEEDRKTRALEDIREILIDRGDRGGERKVEIQQVINATLERASDESEEQQFQEMMLKLMPKIMKRPKVRRAIKEVMKEFDRRG